MAKPKASIRRVLNCRPSQQPDSDWSFGAALEAGAASTVLQPSVDLRRPWWKIGDQGETGSCVGWATADSVLRWHFVEAGLIGQTDLLSVRYIWMAAKELDEFIKAPTTFIEPEGTSLKAALDVARKYGVVSDTALPFAGGTLFHDDANVFYALAARLKIASYFTLDRNLTSWRRWLANNGPILTRLNVDASWYGATASKPNLNVYQANTAEGGHAVAIVGYEDDHFIVRNSWGKQWGDKGYAYASDAYALAAFTEAYGVTLQGGAPVSSPPRPPPSSAAAATASTPRGPKPSAEAAHGPGKPSIDAIEQAVKASADHLKHKDVPLHHEVSKYFADLEAIEMLLATIQKKLPTLGVDFFNVPDAEKAKLLGGDFFGLADWIFRKAAKA